MIPQTRTVIYMAILNQFIIYCYLIGRVDTYNSSTRRRLGASDSIANTPLRSLTISIEANPALSLGNGIQSA
jgi:hypothetical protein